MRKVFLVIIGLLICSNIYAFRATRPPKLTNPIDDGQINQLNEYLEQLWYVQQGRVSIDIVTTSKANADNGSIWIFNDSGTIKLQTKVGGTTYSVTMTP